MVLQNMFERFKRFLDAPKIVHLPLGAPAPTNFPFFFHFPDFLYFASNRANTGVRWFHITTRIETSEKIVPDP